MRLFDPSAIGSSIGPCEAWSWSLQLLEAWLGRSEGWLGRVPEVFQDASCIAGKRMVSKYIYIYSICMYSILVYAGILL